MATRNGEMCLFNSRLDCAPEARRCALCVWNPANGVLEQRKAQLREAVRRGETPHCYVHRQHPREL